MSLLGDHYKHREEEGQTSMTDFDHVIYNEDPDPIKIRPVQSVDEALADCKAQNDILRLRVGQLRKQSDHLQMAVIKAHETIRRFLMVPGNDTNFKWLAHTALELEKALYEGGE